MRLLAALLLLGSTALPAIAGTGEYQVARGDSVFTLWLGAKYHISDSFGKPMGAQLVGFTASPFDSLSAVVAYTGEVKLSIPGAKKTVKMDDIVTASEANVAVRSMRLIAVSTKQAPRKPLLGFRPVALLQSLSLYVPGEGRKEIPWSDTERMECLTFDGWRTVDTAQFAELGALAEKSATPPPSFASPSRHRSPGLAILAFGVGISGGLGLTAANEKDIDQARDLNKAAWGALAVSGLIAVLADAGSQ